MPIGAKLYEAAAPEDENKADGPAEGEVVDEKDSDKKEK